VRWRQVRTSNRQRRRLEALNKHLLFSLSNSPVDHSRKRTVIMIDGKIVMKKI